jgi:ElaB/YqjD/DUF883 family membrane-anchored ribosome-binding protein
MGNTDGEKSGEYRETQAKEAGDIDSMLKQWEEENAASLPPGYKDIIVGGQQSMQQMQQQLDETRQMLQQVLAQSQGVADAARQGVQQGQQQQIDSVRQQIGNNIDRVQQALQLPDDKAEDFMTFAAERGFTLEDFVDPQLTVKVMHARDRQAPSGVHRQSWQHPVCNTGRRSWAAPRRKPPRQDGAVHHGPSRHGLISLRSLLPGPFWGLFF